ncbi:efflux RND transporter periplasmic adaptor subunit [Conexibacter sp. SYSU D00693]|uniref:efflux RND transporter periplasmic adaptor subunit n=1 Tax=Conexibacter sp. SYSU D00693 TaxID=2812560 RepID=UPI00196BA540|nr:peptidoglycan-binding protein [Conexibacter sp. SYSU D00693]
MSRRVVGAGLGVLAATSVAAVLVTSGGGGSSALAQDGGGTAATARVQRTTLTERLTADGTLGFSDERPVIARVQGTVTWLPAEGATVRPGQRLLEVDDAPVVLFDGAVPAWRALASGDEGEDVHQLERGLRALGHDPGTVDDEFTSATAAAVRAWQRDRGLDDTGRVELGRIVFLPGARRVSERKAQLGAPLGGGPALTTTTLHRVVTIDLDAADQAVAREGARADVELPDGTLAPGRVARVGTVATSGGGEDPTDDSGPTVEVTIRLTGKDRGGRLDQAPVSVELARERRTDVLAVPVTALTALRGGGFGVQRIGASGATSVVRVEPGLTADGLVEVQGALREGDRVQVPEA